jgi:peptide/nickel transport system substrate-binding protein
MKRHLRLIAVSAVLVTLAAACAQSGGDAGGGGGDTGQITPGGTYKVGFDGGSDFFYGMDPQKEYYSISWEFLRCCLTRTLLSYKGVPGQEGTKVFPDLAADEPTVSEDKLTWTFTLKDGIMFGDPLNREIVADDFVTAFDRIADPEGSQGGYWFYYTSIEGFQEAYDSDKVNEVSGVTAVDDKTLEIKLAEPLNDLPYLVAMPATSPLPEELASTHDKDVGQFLVSSGPYQWEGMEGLDLKGDDAPSGMQIGKSYVMVRNPAYDPATDDLREGYVDRIEIQVGGEIQDLLDKVDAGVIDSCFSCLGTATTLAKYHSDPVLEERIKVYPSDALTYTGFNVFEPPFDDVHVRKAVNWAIDKAALLRLIGGPDQGQIAGHFIPPDMLGGLLADYDPYASPDSRGDIAKAQEEMALSKYDENGDGKCDGDSCNIPALTVSDDDEAIKTLETMATSFQEIGITLDIQALQYSALVQKCATLDAHTPFCQASWGKDYPSAFTYFDPLLNGGENGSNYSFLGETAGDLEKAGYDVPGEIPTIDPQIDECTALPLEQQNQCWAELDQYVMEEIVPVMPRRFANNIDILGERIENYSFAQFSGQAAVDQISLVNGGAEAA